MSINFSNALGVHEQALQVRSRRAALIASNIANADTPCYKARDIDFKAVLSGENLVESSSSFSVKNKNHIEFNNSASNFEVKFRKSLQPSLDGNSVDSQVEKSEYIQNATQYAASLQFLGQRFKEIMTAIKGE
jgi:flagellar basal-body rod protein FlgB